MTRLRDEEKETRAMKRKTKKPTTAAECLAACGVTADAQRPETTVEWQVTPGGEGPVTYVFSSPGKVFSFLASEWANFVTGWDPNRTTRLGIEIRRVEREKK